MAEVRRTFVEIIGLRPTAADPPDVLERGERGGRRRRIGGLAVVDEGNAVLLTDALHAMRQTGVGAKGFIDQVIRKHQRHLVGALIVAHTERPRYGDRSYRITGVMWALKRSAVLLSAQLIATHLYERPNRTRNSLGDLHCRRIVRSVDCGA